MAKPTTTAPTFTAVVSPADVTAACPFLGNTELAEVLGSTEKIRQPIEVEAKPAGPSKTYHCSYALGDLYVTAFDSDELPSPLIDQKREKCEGAPSPIPGAGEVASRCDVQGGTATVAIAKRSHKQSRIARFDLASRTRTDAYTSLAKLLGDRL
ncbi:hypothetical protein ACIOD2_20175 [Amycolatopsis sp. NPDC088138]|uniref:hypothetical protein n=1 Tax=Amycolatopsis sp. NPDC088138 TaxID=3363938 RepID=UPI00381E7D33